MTFEELVELFFESHDASSRPVSRQYMSAIFYEDEEQERIAREVKARVEERTGRVMQTEIQPASEFYPAEDYHQKYSLQGDAVLARDFAKIYPDIADLIDSTAAARVNGYLYGCGSLEQLQAELDGLGLSPEAGDYLLRLMGDRAGSRP